MAIKKDLTGILAGLGVVGALSAGTALEARAVNGIAQSQPGQNQQLADIWSNKFSLKELYSDAMVLAQEISISDPNYTGELTYIGKKDEHGQISQWTVIGSLYAKANPSKPAYSMKSTGSVGAKGLFVLGTTSVEVSGSMSEYKLLGPHYTNNVLTVVKAGDANQVSAWITGMNGRYQALTIGRSDLKPIK